MKDFMKKYFLAILLTVLTTFAFSSRVGAVSDVVIDLNQDNYATNFLICSNDTSDNVALCSDYNYIKFEYQLDFTTSITIQARRSSPTTFSPVFILSGATNEIITEISDDIYKMRIGGATSLPTTFSIKITLSENSPSVCPTCPEQLPADRSAIMDDFHNVFLKVFVGVIPISAIIFVVWFMIDMLSSLMFGRGK